MSCLSPSRLVRFQVCWLTLLIAASTWTGTHAFVLSTTANQNEALRLPTAHPPPPPPRRSSFLQQSQQQQEQEQELQALLQAKDWQAIDEYWQDLVASQSTTTTTLNLRLKTLGLQGQPAKAQALLRDTLQDNPRIVDQMSWVHVLRAYATQVGRSDKNVNDDDDDDDSSLARIQEIIQEMDHLGRDQPLWKPSISAYNALLKAMAQHANLPQRAQKAEAVLFGLLDKYNQAQENKNDNDPNADTFLYVYQASKGAPYPKVETLWHLQTSLWRQAEPKQADAVVPSVRNLNAALAALGRSHLTDKAAKANLLLQQLQDIQTEYQASNSSSPRIAMTPNVGTYKNIMYACAFTRPQHASPRERRQAWEMVQDVMQTKVVLSSSRSEDGDADTDDTTKLKLTRRDATLFYRLALQAAGQLIENPVQRDQVATQLFEDCCDAGLVDPTVVTAFERAASETTVLRILGGFAEDLIKLPVAWTQHVDVVEK